MEFVEWSNLTPDIHHELSASEWRGVRKYSVYVVEGLCMWLTNLLIVLSIAKHRALRSVHGGSIPVVLNEKQQSTVRTSQNAVSWHCGTILSTMYVHTIPYSGLN